MKGLIRKLMPSDMRLSELGILAALLVLFICALLTVPADSIYGVLRIAVSVISFIILAFLLYKERTRRLRFMQRLSVLLYGGGGTDDMDEMYDDDGTGAVENFLKPDEPLILEQLEERLSEYASSDALKTEAELHALQNQINPHFLYNTLEIIRSRALIQGSSDVAEMVESLALQFRYCINNQGEMVTLQQELDHVHNYLLIQRYRFGSRIKYKEVIHDIDGQITNCRITMLTLQPIIENALIHGINPKVEGGTITLRVYPSGSRLFIYIDDDGVGISEESLKKMRGSLLDGGAPAKKRDIGQKSPGIALSNVNQRIKLYFGEDYGVDVSSTIGVGTSVCITIPFAYMD